MRDFYGKSNRIQENEDQEAKLKRDALAAHSNSIAQDPAALSSMFGQSIKFDGFNQINNIV